MELEIYREETISEKVNLIQDQLNQKKVIVAFSGGVDSTVMGYLSKLYSKETLLVMQTGASVAIGEEEFASKQADQLDLPLKFINYDEVDYSQKYADNPDNRCYYCKQLLHGFLNKIKEDMNYDIIVTGTNASDLGGHRPGYQAAIEAGVLNPLADAGITKQEVRWIATDAGLNASDKPASACLASRFVTGVKITKKGLRRIAEAEYYLKQEFNLQVVRVRDHGGLARIEIGQSELQDFIDRGKFDEVSHQLTELGFDFVTLDMKGYRPYVPPLVKE